MITFLQNGESENRPQTHIEESEKKPNDVERKYRQELKEKNENEN